MKSFVLDCSVTMGWCFVDENDVYTRRILSLLATSTAVVPVLWAAEVSHVLVTAERKKRIRQSDSAKFLDMALALPISFDAALPRIHEVTQLARSFALSSYDAFYLELAMRLGVPLATTDKVLRRAASSAGVALFE